MGAAADALMAVPQGGTVLITTGLVSRAWISPLVGENDGPSGAAAIARALVLGRNAICVVLCEETLLSPIRAVMVAAGLTPVTLEQAAIARDDRSLATVVMMPYPVDDVAGQTVAKEMLDTLQPSLLVFDRACRAKCQRCLSLHARDRLWHGPREGRFSLR